MRRLVVLSILLVLTANAFASGFQVTAQGARAMGMGLAASGVPGDASSIYYNPAALAYRTDSTAIIGAMLATNLEAQYTAAGTSVTEEQKQSLNTLPQAYYATKLGPVVLGIGAYTPFGLPLQWEDRDTFSGRRISYLANIRTANINPTAAMQFGNVGVGVGIDWVHSKLQLERRSAITIPGLGTRDVIDAKLKSDLMDADGWGWNAGVMWRSSPTGGLALGASYRSAIEIEHEPELTLTQIPTGIATVDALVAGMIPAAPVPTQVDIELPASLNLGASFTFGGGTVIAAEADRTEWSSFGQLAVVAPAPFGTLRATNWDDSWAYRAGVEVPCGGWKCRAGAYRDQTPQPLADVGPVLPDADRNAFTVGLGIPVSSAWTLDIGYAHVMFEDRTTTTATTDALAGLWETTGAELAVNLRYH